MPIIQPKIGQNGKDTNAQLYFPYRDSNQNMIYIDGNHIKGSFD